MIRNFINGEYNLNVVSENNEPLFFGKEVAEMLGYVNTRDAIQRYIDPEDKIEFKDLQGSRSDRLPFQYQPNRILINEIGLYSLVFGSQLPQAKDFRKWVFGEVLPQIWKTGSYSLNTGLLKLRDISEQDVEKMDEVDKKEFKKELRKFSELLKDPDSQRRGHNGGIVLWKKLKAKEEELDSLREKIENVRFILNN